VRRGAHPPLTLLPVGEPLERVLALKTLRMITMAPELEGALDAIVRFVARHVVVSLGHTDATYEQAVAGLQAGATMFTHLFNAMPPLHHRAPGVVGAAAGIQRSAHSARPFVGVIPDGVHLHPATLHLLIGLPLVFTTDRVSLAGEGVAARAFGQPSASLRVQDGASRFSDGSLAGSVITMHDAAKRLTDELGGDWARVAQACSQNPARLLGLLDRGSVELGQRADLILVDEQFNLKAIYIHGREID
jgi:N-acetylglucosamine-6-phosphate deacetylase